MTKVAIACQGGGTHAAFAAGVLTEILSCLKEARTEAMKPPFQLIGLSGTSAGALCALMTWYGLAPKTTAPKKGSLEEAIAVLNNFWDGFSAGNPPELALNFLSFSALATQEKEVPVLGINAPIFGLNPYGLVSHSVTKVLPYVGVSQQYFDFDEMIKKVCPRFGEVDWPNVTVRLLLGASEVINGYETTFDSDSNDPALDAKKHYRPSAPHVWSRRLPIDRHAVAASGTLPLVREAEKVGRFYYWDGLYSQNPPVREFFSGTFVDYVPDEIWIVRINPQQRNNLPQTNADIQDRENELMGNLSLNKELDFLLSVNELLSSNKIFKRTPSDHADSPGQADRDRYKAVTVRTIKMTKDTALSLQTSSKYDRNPVFINKLRDEGRAVAKDWLTQWKTWVTQPHGGNDSVRYPLDAAHYNPPDPDDRNGS